MELAIIDLLTEEFANKGCLIEWEGVFLGIEMWCCRISTGVVVELTPLPPQTEGGIIFLNLCLENMGLPLSMPWVEASGDGGRKLKNGGKMINKDWLLAGKE